MNANRINLPQPLSKIIDLGNSTESSSDDEGENDKDGGGPGASAVGGIVKRRKTVPKMKDFIDTVVHCYSDEEFQQNFGISRDIAEYLVEKYSSSSWYVVRHYRGGRRPKSAENNVLSFLWFAAHKTTYRETGYLFDMSLSKIYDIFNKVSNFIVKVIGPQTIRFPREQQEKENTAKEFESIAGFPNVLGCIDVTIILSRKPRYANKSEFGSITLKAICDANLRFLDVFTGVPSDKDKHTYSNSVNGTKVAIINKEMQMALTPKYYLLGDSAFPLRECLLTPYAQNLGEAELLYNQKFYATNARIREAFGILKSRFRQLQYLNLLNPEQIANFVLACCVVHNICIERGDVCDLDVDDCDEIVTTAAGYGKDDKSKDLSPLTQLGLLKREEIKNLLYERKKAGWI